MRPESFDDMVAEQAAQQQVMLMALRRIAALTRKAGGDPAEIRKYWIEDGHTAIDKTTFLVAPGHTEVVKLKAKARLDEIIEVGLR